MRRIVIFIVLLSFFRPYQVISQDADHFKDKGKEYYKSGKYEEALTNFLKYQELASNSYYPYNQLGWTYYYLGKYQDAITNFNKSNKIKESYGNYQGLGRCYDALEDYENSLQYYLKYAKLHPENSNSWRPHNSLGWTYFNLQMYYDAIEEFKSSILINPIINSYLGLCNVYMDLDDYDKARDILLNLAGRTKKEQQESVIKIMLGYCHVSQGRLEEAYKVFGNRNTLGLRIKNAQNGIKILSVRKNGPGYLAGLKPGDVMMEINGISLDTVSVAKFSSKILYQQEFGAKVKLKIYRDGYYDDKYVYLGISPEIYNLAQNDPDCIRQRKEAGTEEDDVKINIAVSTLNAQGVSEEDALALSSRLRSALFNTYKYNVLEREKMKEILREQGFQQAGATSDEKLVQAGKLLNMEYIVGGSINRIGEVYSISLRLINVESGNISSVATEDIKGSIEDVYTSGVRNVVYKLIQYHINFMDQVKLFMSYFTSHYHQTSRKQSWKHLFLPWSPHTML
ncbi:MAG: PDZ domain-containing protein [bacterium]